MISKISIETIYHCSLERAFKTPFLCDISKIHTGFGIIPNVTHCEEDENWGRPGFEKKVIMGKSLIFKGGFASRDKVIERVENDYWKIEVSDFQIWMMGFAKLSGEWRVEELEAKKISIKYSYKLHSKYALLYPFNWLFAKTFWRTYMKRVLRNIEALVNDKAPYLYS